MGNLENLLYYFIKKFPQALGRTMLIKAVYLLDCEWYKSFGETYSGLKYIRDNNGPFDTDFYQAKDYLINEQLINEIGYPRPGGYGYKFSIKNGFYNVDDNINIVAKSIADEIVDMLAYKELDFFIDTAYSTNPMKEVLEEENQSDTKKFGRVLDMAKNKKTLSPLFNFDEIRDAAKSLDQSKRGSDEDYNKTIIDEMNELSVYRERVEAVCQQVD